MTPSDRPATLTSTTGDSLRDRKKRDTWRVIHATALRLMVQRGFDAVSIDDIVAAAGISRRTFFNYFAGKESVVFDPDPDDPTRWAVLMGTRPAAEPLWRSLRELLLGYTQATAERMVVQRRVRQASPELATCSREVADHFWIAVRDWAGGRVDAPALHLDLTVNAARTVLNTACPRWTADSGIAGLHQLLRTGFDVLGAGLNDRSAEWTKK